MKTHQPTSYVGTEEKLSGLNIANNKIIQEQAPNGNMRIAQTRDRNARGQQVAVEISTISVKKQKKKNGKAVRWVSSINFYTFQNTYVYINIKNNL